MRSTLHGRADGRVERRSFATGDALDRAAVGRSASCPSLHGSHARDLERRGRDAKVNAR